MPSKKHPVRSGQRYKRMTPPRMTKCYHACSSSLLLTKVTIEKPSKVKNNLR